MNKSNQKIDKRSEKRNNANSPNSNDSNNSTVMPYHYSGVLNNFLVDYTFLTILDKFVCNIFRYLGT